MPCSISRRGGRARPSPEWASSTAANRPCPYGRKRSCGRPPREARGGGKDRVALIADSGGLYALYDARDKNHRAAREAVAAETGPIILPTAILGEIDYRLRVKLGVAAEMRLLEGIANDSLKLEAFTAQDAARCLELLEKIPRSCSRPCGCCRYRNRGAAGNIPHSDTRRARLSCGADGARSPARAVACGSGEAMSWLTCDKLPAMRVRLSFIRGKAARPRRIGLLSLLCALAPLCGAAAVSGEAVYKARCALCHDSDSPNYPSRETLKRLPAARILRVLTSGEMMSIAAALTKDEREAVASFLGTSAPAFTLPPQAYCRDRSVKVADASTLVWNGWSPGVANMRYQGGEAAGLSLDQTRRLKFEMGLRL